MSSKNLQGNQKWLLVGIVFLLVSMFVFGNMQTNTANAVVATTLFSDGFESGNFSNWTSNNGIWSVTTAPVNSGTKTGMAKGNTTSTLAILKKNLSTSGYMDITFGFWFYGVNLESDDALNAQWTSDGSTWNTIRTITSGDDNSTWTNVSVNLPSGANNNPNFAIRFTSNFNQGNDTVRIDDVSVTGTAIPVVGSISGKKFNDANGNATNDSEAGISEWSISIYKDGSLYDSTSTNEDGTYTFSDLGDGTYVVCEGTSEGWVQTLPVAGSSCENGTKGYSIVISAGNNETSKDFGNRQYGKIVIVKNTNPVEAVDENEEEINFQFTSSFDEPFSLADGEEYTSTWLAPGTYSVSETELEGWDLTNTVCSDGSTISEISLTNGETITCTFTNTQRGNIVLEKVADPNEGTFKFTLSGEASDETQFIGSGTHTFSNLRPGSYTLSEILPDGWDGTQYAVCGDNDNGTTNGSITITLNAGQTIQCVFANTENGVIIGRKINDKNGDGELTRKEGGVKNWEITLTRIDTEEQTTQTMSTIKGGYFTFSGLKPGTYLLCEGTKSSWHQTYPKEGSTCENETFGYQLDLRAGEVKSGIKFGNYKDGKITGLKFEDKNGNGIKDRGESGLKNWTIYIDSNNNGQLDETEQSTTTNKNGKYSIDGLAPGEYIVSEVQQEGWVQTLPSGEIDSYSIVITSGKNAKNKNFGNGKISTLSGYKWNDTNNNGSWDEGELGINNWEIQATSGETSKTAYTDESGYYKLTFGPSETGIWTISEIQKGGWDQTYPNEIPYYTIEIEYGNNLSEYNFGNYQNEEQEETPTPTPTPTPTGDGRQGGNGGGSTPTPTVTPTSGSGSTPTPTPTTTPEVLGESTSNNNTGEVLGESKINTCPDGDYITKYMRIGAKNDPEEVKKLQTFLNKNLGINLEVNGFFGVSTFNAVKQFQTKYANEVLLPWGLNSNQATGYAYKTTLRMINILECEKDIPLPKLP